MGGFSKSKQKSDDVFLKRFKTKKMAKIQEDETQMLWKTFSLTYVEYPNGDYVGKLLAMLSLSPLVVVIVFLTFFAAKRDMHTMTYGIGTILNGILNYILKHTIKEARPTN